MAVDEQRAGQIRDRFAQTSETIEGNRLLSEEGKAAQLAAAYLQARADMDAMRTAAAQNTETAIRRLKVEIFGRPPSPSDSSAVLSYRDADRWAARFDAPNELLEVLLQAYDGEDLVLGAAVLRRSMSLAAKDPIQGSRFDRIIEVYDQMVPGALAKLRELAALERPSSNRDRTRQRVRDDLVMTLAKPRRLTGLNDGELARLAADA